MATGTEPANAELETYFLQRIQPYEDRIKRLEDSEQQKEAEIATLKLAIDQLKAIIEELPHDAVKKPGTNGTEGHGQRPGTSAGNIRYINFIYRKI